MRECPPVTLTIRSPVGSGLIREWFHCWAWLGPNCQILLGDGAVVAPEMFAEFAEFAIGPVAEGVGEALAAFAFGVGHLVLAFGGRGDQAASPVARVELSGDQSFALHCGDLSADGGGVESECGGQRANVG